MADYDTAAGHETIIAALCAYAPNINVRDCLRKYDPQKPAHQIEKAFKSVKKEVLVETLSFLGVPGMDDCLSASLPHELLCRVQNFFPDRCDICKQSYIVKLHEKPIISCVVCGQGCHNPCILQLLGKTEQDHADESQNLQALLNPNAAAGFFYLCQPCQEAVVPKKQKIKKKARQPPQSAQETIARTDPSTLSPQDLPADNSNTQETVEPSDNVDPGDSQENVAEARARPRIGSSQTSICRFYKQNRCKHGISGKKDGICRFEHPKPCKKLLNNGIIGPRGCAKGDKCEDFHPKMCQRSLKERICTNQKCEFIHVKHTRRNELQQQSSTKVEQSSSIGNISQTRMGLSHQSTSANAIAVNTVKPVEDDMKIFQTSVITQLQRVLDRMSDYENKIKLLEATVNIQSQTQHNLGFNPARTFLANPPPLQGMNQYQLQYPLLYQNPPPNLAPAARLPPPSQPGV